MTSSAPAQNPHAPVGADQEGKGGLVPGKAEDRPQFALRERLRLKREQLEGEPAVRKADARLGIGLVIPLFEREGGELGDMERLVVGLAGKEADFKGHVKTSCNQTSGCG